MQQNTINMDLAVRDIEIAEATSEVVSEPDVTGDPIKTCGNCYEFNPIHQLCHCPMNASVCEFNGHFPPRADASDVGCMFWQKTN